MADSSRLTATWRNRASAAKRAISGVIQPSGRLATSVMPHAAAASATHSATASAPFVDVVIWVRSADWPWLSPKSAKHPSENVAMQVAMQVWRQEPRLERSTRRLIQAAPRNFRSLVCSKGLRDIAGERHAGARGNLG